MTTQPFTPIANIPAESLELVQRILNSKKIRYEVLDQVLKLRLAKQAGKTINIYIDHVSIIKQLYTPELLPHFNSINAKDRLMISAELINLMAHYRHYFASRLKMYTNLYYIYSFEEAKYQKNLFPAYKSDYYFKRLAQDGSNPLYQAAHRSLLQGINIARSVANYIPHAYFLDSKDIEPALLPYYLITSKEKPEEEFNLILTNDDAFYQDLNLPNTMIMEMRGSEKSELIDVGNVVGLTLRGTKKTAADFPLISVELMETVVSMIANKEYSVPAIARRGYSTSYSALSKLIEKNEIEIFKLPDPEYTKSLAPKLFPKEDQQEAYKLNVDVMSHKLGVEAQQHLIKPLVESQLIDFYNPTELRQAADGAFKKFPLHFEYAYEGEMIRKDPDSVNTNP